MRFRPVFPDLVTYTVAIPACFTCPNGLDSIYSFIEMMIIILTFQYTHARTTTGMASFDFMLSLAVA